MLNYVDDISDVKNESVTITLWIVCETLRTLCNWTESATVTLRFFVRNERR